MPAARGSSPSGLPGADRLTIRVAGERRAAANARSPPWLWPTSVTRRVSIPGIAASSRTAAAASRASGRASSHESAGPSDAPMPRLS